MAHTQQKLIQVPPSPPPLLSIASQFLRNNFLINDMANVCHFEASCTSLLGIWRRRCRGKLVVINKRVHWCKAGITQSLFIALVINWRSTANTLCVRRRSWNQKQVMFDKQNRRSKSSGASLFLSWPHKTGSKLFFPSGNLSACNRKHESDQISEGAQPALGTRSSVTPRVAVIFVGMGGWVFGWD